MASVNDLTTRQAMDVMRFELDTFVCDGQYSKGMEDILEIFFKNINQAQQPAVWVSGFYGSGKSHLVKMFRALWVDTVLLIKVGDEYRIQTEESAAWSENLSQCIQTWTDLARTLKTQADVDAWLDQARKLLMDKLSQGPILV